MKILNTLWIVLFLFTFKTMNASEPKLTLLVDAAMRACSDVPSKKCYLVKVNGSSQWQLISSIGEFKYKEGYVYTLEVKSSKNKIDPTKVDYTFVKQLKKSKSAPLYNSKTDTIQVPKEKINMNNRLYNVKVLTPFLFQVSDVQVPYINFLDGKISGFSGCNRFNCTYTLNDEQINFGPIAMTKMACMGKASEIETMFVEAINKTKFFLLIDNRLQWLDENRAVVIEFFENKPTKK